MDVIGHKRIYTNNRQNDIKKQKNNSMNKLIEKDLKQKIERLEVFEEKFQIRIENVSIRIDDSQEVKIFCEVFPINGSQIEQDISIEFILYDKEGLILDKVNEYIDSEEFYGFEVIEANFYEEGLANEIGKIRIYPKKG